MLRMTKQTDYGIVLHDPPGASRPDAQHSRPSWRRRCAFRCRW